MARHVLNSFHCRSSSSAHLPLVRRQTGAITWSSCLTCARHAEDHGSSDDITLSMMRPVARSPAPCIRRLLLGGLPHASGNVDFNRGPVRHEDLPNTMKLVSPVARFLYGKRHPEGEEIFLDYRNDRCVGYDRVLLFRSIVDARRINW